MSDETTRVITPAATPADDISPEAALREARLQRNLKIAIVIMSALMFAGLIAVAYRIITGPSKRSAIAATQVLPLATDAAISVELPAGTKVIAIDLDGDRMAIQHQGQSGLTITIIDVVTGERIRDVRLTGAVPRN